MKMILTTAAVMLFAFSAQCQETVYRSEIPSKARSFIASNFRSPFNHAVKDTDDEATVYGITLNDKTEIQFFENGAWRLVDGKGKPVPYKFLDKQIVDYMRQNHANETVTRIERCESECRVALSNGKGLKFDSSGNLVAYSK